MSESRADQISVSHEMGGMREFERTGVYPNKLVIRSKQHKMVWRIKLKGENQKGVLCIRRVPIYNYWYRKDGFSYQILENKTPVSDWILVNDMVIVMCD